MTCSPLMFLICCNWLAKCWQITTKLNPKIKTVFLEYISLWLWNTSVSELLHVKNNISHSHSSQLCSKKFFYMFSGVGQLLVLPGVGWVLPWHPRMLSPPVQCPAPSLSTLFLRDQLQQVAQGHAQSHCEYLYRRRLHICFWQSVPVLDHPHNRSGLYV